jgi:acyl-coenzyme A thioesterase PaaI-like protein
MLNASKIIEKAKHSAFWLWVLNIVHPWRVPFNGAHGFRIMTFSDLHLRVRIPYRRSNLNHIRGLHACALATVTEFATGFLLLSRLDPSRYRMIMQRIEMDYHYQGKMDAIAEFTLTEEWLRESIINPLESADAVVVPCVVKIHDAEDNHLTTGKVYWQFKNWSKVRTKA